MLRVLHSFKTVFLCVDIGILTLAFSISFTLVFPNYIATSHPPIYSLISHLFLYMLFIIIFIFSFWCSNLYKRNVLTSQYRHAVLLSRTFLLAISTIIVLMVICNSDYAFHYGKRFLLYFSAISFCLFILFRCALGRAIFIYLAKSHLYTSRILIVGGDDAAKKSRSSSDACSRRIRSSWISG